MKRVFKNPIIMFVLGALIFSSISVYAAHKYYASDITYKETTLDKALDTLYTTQNTTVNNLNSQVSTLSNEKTALQSQISSKDATISNLTSQINELTTNNCIKKTITFNQSSTTSSGQKLVDFAPTFLIWLFDDKTYSFNYPNIVNTSTLQYDVELASKSIEGPYESNNVIFTSNSVIEKNLPSRFVGQNFDIVACK